MKFNLLKFQGKWITWNFTFLWLEVLDMLVQQEISGMPPETVIVFTVL